MLTAQNNGPSVGFAMAGGVFLCMGNLGTQYALAYTNLSLTEVVSSSLTVVGGTILNYFLDGRRALRTAYGKERLPVEI
jgi:drug/metabolite transporter (DMT)-like permease